MARDGHVIREGGRGQQNDLTTPTCAKFSDVEALVVALEKSGRAISRARHLFSSQQRVGAYPVGVRNAKAGSRG